MSAWDLVLVAGAGLLFLALLAYAALRLSYLRFELLFDRPQGEEPLLVLKVWLPPFLRFELRHPADPPGEPAAPPAPDLDQLVPEQGRTILTQLRAVAHTVSMLAKHELHFLGGDSPGLARAQFVVRLIERVPWWTEEFRWVTRFGVGDPALTGLLTGVVWSIKGTVFGLLNRNMRLLREPVIRVDPDFQSFTFRTTVRCIVRVRLGDIITAGAGLWLKERGIAWKPNTRLKA